MLRIGQLIVGPLLRSAGAHNRGQRLDARRLREDRRRAATGVVGVILRFDQAFGRCGSAMGAGRHHTGLGQLLSSSLISVLIVVSLPHHRTST